MALTEKQQEAIDKIKQKSDDDYEKNVVYIAAGTLVLSMTFLEKIIKLESSIHVWILVTSWIFLAGTLFFNLLSHQLSSVFHERCIEHYNGCGQLAEDAPEEVRETYNASIDEANGKLDGYNRTIRRLNWGTTISLFLGIALLVTFCSVNALNTKPKIETVIQPQLIDTTMSKQVKTQVPNIDTTKGRTISASVKPVTQSSNTTNSSNGQNSGSSSTSNQSTNR